MFASGVALGFSLTVPPGPMNALIASQTAMRGTKAGMVTGAGAMTADLILGIAVYLARTLVDLRPLVRFIYLVGSAVLFLLAYFMLAGRKTVMTEEVKLRTYSRAVLIGVSNPFQVLWWLTAGLAFAYLGGIVLLAGLFTAVAVWIILFPLLLHMSTKKHPRASKAVTAASVIIMLFFAGYFLFSAL